MRTTNFDRYLAQQLQDTRFAARFERAGHAWDVALQIAALREQAGLSQKELARLLNTRRAAARRSLECLRRRLIERLAAGRFTLEAALMLAASLRRRGLL